jgi:hypothetical protein
VVVRPQAASVVAYLSFALAVGSLFAGLDVFSPAVGSPALRCCGFAVGISLNSLVCFDARRRTPCISSATSSEASWSAKQSCATWSPVDIYGKAFEQVAYWSEVLMVSCSDRQVCGAACSPAKLALRPGYRRTAFPPQNREAVVLNEEAESMLHARGSFQRRMTK